MTQTFEGTLTTYFLRVSVINALLRVYVDFVDGCTGDNNVSERGPGGRHLLSSKTSNTLLNNIELPLVV